MFKYIIYMENQHTFQHTFQLTLWLTEKCANCLENNVQKYSTTKKNPSRLQYSILI